MFILILCGAIAIAILVYMLMAPRKAARGTTGVRRGPRIPIVVPVQIATADARYFGDSQNVSRGGMLIRVDAPVSIAQPLQLSFQLPHTAKVNIPAVVAHKHRADVGIRFDPTHQDRRIIEQWVDESARELAKAGS